MPTQLLSLTKKYYSMKWKNVWFKLSFIYTNQKSSQIQLISKKISACHTKIEYETEKWNKWKINN